MVLSLPEIEFFFFLCVCVFEDVPHPGTDYSPEAVRLAEAYVLHENLQSHITIMLDNILETTIKRQFDVLRTLWTDSPITNTYVYVFSLYLIREPLMLLP